LALTESPLLCVVTPFGHTSLKWELQIAFHIGLFLRAATPL
jgi:hypothetical protein